MQGKPPIDASQPFAELLLRGARQHGDRDCIVMSDDRVTYGELGDRAMATARSLLALGVERGDRVGILMANCLDFVDVMFGASLIGAVPVLYNGRFKSREIQHVTVDAAVRVLITNDAADEHTNYVELLQRALPGLDEIVDPSAIDRLPAAPNLRAVMSLSDTVSAGFLTRAAFAALADRVEPGEVEERHRATKVEDTAMMFYTSGTTAMPKGCPLSHAVLTHAGIVGGVDRFGLVEGDVMWGPLPMFHTAFTQPLTGILHVSGTFCSMTHFDAGAALDMITSEGVTVMFPAFPTITMQLLNHPAYDRDTFSAVRCALNVGPPDVLRAMQAELPHTMQITAFGLTETGGSVAMTEPSDSLELRTETSGRALPGNELAIIDPDSGVRLEPGQRGEIVARGRGVFSGYFNDPVKTAEAIDADGWFRTGDLGSLDDDGRVTFHGRLKDMLKVGGENVACVEVEGYLATHPAVNLAQVVGLPDKKYEEVPVAFVELRPGEPAESVTEAEIIDFCRGQIASFKIPRHVRFVDEWPMGATKILKYVLRDRIVAEMSQGTSGGGAH